MGGFPLRYKKWKFWEVPGMLEVIAASPTSKDGVHNNYLVT